MREEGSGGGIDIVDRAVLRLSECRYAVVGSVETKASAPDAHDSSVWAWQRCRLVSSVAHQRVPALLQHPCWRFSLSYGGPSTMAR